MSVLVTGAAGFIGQHLVKLLSSKGTVVHVLCRNGGPEEWLADGNIKPFRGDILDGESVRAAMRGCDQVFHLAGHARNWAYDPGIFYSVNVGGLSVVLDAAELLGVHRVVFTSSSVTLGPSHGVPLDGSAHSIDPPFTHYEQSKRLAEELAWRHIQNGQDIVIVNPTRVFGPGILNEGNSVTRMIKWYMEGKVRFTIGSGREIGNYAFVYDVALGHVLAMERGIAGERYILGGENVSYADLMQVTAELSDRYYRRVRIPDSVALAFARIEELRGRASSHQPLITAGWVRMFLSDWACSLGKSERDLGYHHTPLPDALRYTIGWLSTGGKRSISPHLHDETDIVVPSAQ